MMADYHIGSLDEKSLSLLAGAEPAPEPQERRPAFLQSKVWSKATLTEKRKISPDTKVFTFKLGHEAQVIGLPIGQHLMMRLRDPVSSEAIIRAYTPISETTERGKLEVLVKIYYDTAGRRDGGKMTQALDSVPLGQFVEFKGPVGKFEYLGNGVCSVSGKNRRVRRFIMVCAGSGITPIFQVLRAVLKDKQDPTYCFVLNGNRMEEDILCKAELDDMAVTNKNKCEVLYTLSRPRPAWRGRKGRMDRQLFEYRVGGPPSRGDALVLICGPESMEESVHKIFLAMGWKDEDLMFF
jgi:nitrate reductase (NAD(P)H)